MRSIPISEFCETSSGGTPSRDRAGEFYGGGIPWVKSGELREYVITSTEETLTEAGLRSSSAKVVPAGSILIAMYGATVGRMATLGIDACTNQAVCAIRPDPKIADSRYVFHALSAKVPHFLSQARGGAQPNISQGLIRATEIRLPWSLDEQRRVATILDKVDSLRRKRQDAIRLADEFLKAVFFDMFGDPVTNPKDWLTKALGEVCSKIGSGATPKGGDAAYKDEGIALIRSMNVRDGTFLWKDLAHIDDEQAMRLSNVVVEEDDVLINITGASVARVCRAPREVVPARVNQHVSILRPFSGVEAPFLEQQLLAPSVKQKLLQIGEAGATRQAITKAELEAFQIIVPPEQMQARFSRVQMKVAAFIRKASESALAGENLAASLQSQFFGEQ